MGSFHARRHPLGHWRSSLPYRLASVGPAAHRPPVLHTRCGARCAVFNKDVVTFSNHGRLLRDTSAGVLRAEVARWVRTLPHRVEVKARTRRSPSCTRSSSPS
ncbi:hypothetical protein NJ76_21135 [Rhodococcus sp. IITR03]|nr:hypothetical protein NJ76_21135 [Rhodococcus sp. IITR03]